jgi:hypothetical protein
VEKLFPEIVRISESFGEGTLQEWCDRMEQHNNLLHRGASMRLCKKAYTSRLTHCSLDLFMLQMHSDSIADALDNFSAFGNRILPLVASNPDAQTWWLNSEVSIQRRHWRMLRRRIAGLIHLMGFTFDDSIVAIEAQSTPIPLSPWPDHSRLSLAARRAMLVFGESSGCRQPTLRELYWPIIDDVQCHLPGSC